MSKTAILLHGTGGDDKDYFWFNDTKTYLSSHGYQVWWPHMPNADKPNLKDSLNFLSAEIPTLGKDTILVGHSSACPLILSLLQDQSNVSVKQVVLVAGFYQSIDNEGVSDLMLEDHDWNLLREHSSEYILINSDNDPWGCDDKQAIEVAKKLGGFQIVASGQGHMGSNSFNQPYREFDLLKRLLKI